jgi:hypothetical protein
MLWPHTKALVVFDCQLTILFGEMEIAKIVNRRFLPLEATSFLIYKKL